MTQMPARAATPDGARATITDTAPVAPPGSAEPSPRLLRGAGALLLAEGLLLFVPLLVMGPTIGWPASLDSPVQEYLPEIAANETVVRVGYLSYLVYSLLFFPVIAYYVAAFAGPAGRMRTLARVAVGFAALSALARALGIVRWLTAMPVLADEWVAGDEQLRQIIAVQYRTLNDYAGGVGELLGVASLAAAAIGCAVVVASSGTPRWLTVFGLVATAAAALPALELAGIDPGAALTPAVTVIQFWFMAAGIALLLRARRAPSRV